MASDPTRNNKEDSRSSNLIHSTTDAALIDVEHSERENEVTRNGRANPGKGYYSSNCPTGYSVPSDQSPPGDRIGTWRSRRCHNERQLVPIDPTNWFDMIISCGFGAKSYRLGPGFADPQFKRNFITKVYFVLLVQLMIYILWMTLVLTSKTLLEMHQQSYGLIICSSLIYIFIYGSVRFTQRGEDGLCLMSYLIMFIFLSVCGAIISGWLVVLFPFGIFVTSSIWLTIAVLALGNICCNSLSILTNVVYGLTFCGAVTSSTVMGCLYHYYFDLDHDGTMADKLWQFILPLSLVPLLALMLVYEFKRLIGGRRTNLNDHEWIVAAIVL